MYVDKGRGVYGCRSKCGNLGQVEYTNIVKRKGEGDVWWLLVEGKHLERYIPWTDY